MRKILETNYVGRETEEELANKRKHVTHQEDSAKFWFLIISSPHSTNIQFEHDVFCHNELRFCIKATRRQNQPVTIITGLTNPALKKVKCAYGEL
jgi:hypothetical protein